MVPYRPGSYELPVKGEGRPINLVPLLPEDQKILFDKAGIKELHAPPQLKVDRNPKQSA